MTAKGQWLGPQLGIEQVRTEGCGGERLPKTLLMSLLRTSTSKTLLLRFPSVYEGDPPIGSVGAEELKTYKKRYNELVIRDIHEIARLRRSRSEYVEALEIRLGRLKDYLNNEEPNGQLSPS
ncbi:unnamed protein product [Cochlearia groenlandica]